MNLHFKRELKSGEHPGFAPALAGSDVAKDIPAFPDTPLVRILTGDIKPEWIMGLGKMTLSESGRKEYADGYKDTFVSCVSEYQKMGIDISPGELNSTVFDFEKASRVLDLSPLDVAKIKDNGIWIIYINPGCRIATPTECQSEWNPHYEEGGKTKSGMREWVTPNVAIEEEARARNIQIFKVDKNGHSKEWRYSSISHRLVPRDQWEKEINKRAHDS